MNTNDKKIIRNLITEIKEGESIYFNGPAQVTLLEAIRNGNNKKCLISIKATNDVKITREK